MFIILFIINITIIKMKDQLISLETAKLAKEKGFNISTQIAYIDDKLFTNFEDSHGDEREYYFDANDFYEDWNRKDWVFSKDGGECFGCKLDNKKWFEAYSAPTQSILQRWLRENHNLFITIEPYIGHDYDIFYGGKIFKRKATKTSGNIKIINTNIFYSSYEDTLERALYEALTLIK